MPSDFSTLVLPVTPFFATTMKLPATVPKCYTFEPFPFPHGGRVYRRYLQIALHRYPSKTVTTSPDLKTMARIYGLHPMNLGHAREALDHKCAICGIEETQTVKNGQVMACISRPRHVSGTVEGCCVNRCNF